MDDLAGRTFFVTGANTGIGRETVRALASRGATVFLACRSEAKTRAVIKELGGETGNSELEFLPLDLADLQSVRACADAFLATGRPLHALINNAGIAGQRGRTASGFELAFGTNYVGPFLLTDLLLGRLEQSAPARVVNVASKAHYNATGIDFDVVREPTRSLTGLPEYAVSKLANVLHAEELARRHDEGLTAYSLHPGVIASDIWRRVPWPIRPVMKLAMRSPREGAQTTVHCATAPDLANESGAYYEDSHRKRPGKAVTPELGAELWERTMSWVAAQ